MSGGSLVLADESAEDGLAAYPSLFGEIDDLGWWAGRGRIETAVGPMLVVVAQVFGEDAAQVAFAEDERAIGHLGAQSADPAFRVVPRLPGVVSVFHVAGSDDYLLHIAVRDSDALRDFVLDHLTSHPAVRHTQTSLIFAHLPGTLAGIGLSD